MDELLATLLASDAAAVRAKVAELDKTNRHDITIPLLRNAFEAGLDPYFALDVVTRVWDKKGCAKAIKEIHRCSEALPVIAFSFQGDDFHKNVVARALRGLALLIAYELGSAADASALVVELTDHVKSAIWQRLWQLVHIQDRDAIGRLGVIYPYAYGRDPLQTIFAVDYFLARYGFWNEALDALMGMAINESTPKGLMSLRLAWLVEVNLNLGRIVEAESAFNTLCAPVRDGYIKNEFSDPNFVAAIVNALWSKYYHAGLRAEDHATIELREFVVQIREIARAKASSQTTVWCFEQMTLLLAHIEEDAGKIGAAETLYLQSSQFLPGNYLPNPFQRAPQFLAAHGHWHEGAAIHRNGVLALWPYYDSLTKVPAKDRYRGDTVLPDRAVVLNCEGIGDDIWRIIMFVRFKGYDANLAFVVDDRLQSCLQRGLPHCEFLVRSRGSGSHAVDVETYHNDRIGVPESVDLTRITTQIMEKIAEYGEVCLSEDVFYEYFRNRGEFPFLFDRPILLPDPDHKRQATEWLLNLPAGNINVGISWRTGLRSAFRDRNQFKIDQLGRLLTLPNINWILLQYSVTEEELHLAQRLFGTTLHHMPGVNLRDDIDKIIGIVSSLDLVVSSNSTILPLTAASGTPVLGMGPGFYSVLQFRISTDGETDRILPRTVTLTARRFGTKAAIVAEAACRVRKFSSSRDLSKNYRD